MFTYRKQKGWTLIELLLVIVCTLAFAAVTVYSLAWSVQKQRDLQQAVSDISELVQAAHSWKLAQPLATYWYESADHPNNPGYNSGYECLQLNVTRKNYTPTDPKCEVTQNPNTKRYGISLMDLGFISKNWPAQDDFTIQGVKDSTSECGNYGCFRITYNSGSWEKNCALAAHFRSTAESYQNVKPTIAACKEIKENHEFGITYV